MSRERVQKLPGRRRGLIRGASVWLGSGYLLSVKSSRFREEYKRFYFRDIQAIAVAKAPRFHLSTRSMLIGFLWLMAFAVVSASAPVFRIYLWAVAALLVLAWLVISSLYSCRCRIYTAVSREELPSVYRVWTARKFIERVTPQITQVQGSVDPGWAEQAPATESLRGSSIPEGMGSTAALHPNARVHTRAADLLVATLFASAAADLLLLRTTAAATQVQVVSALALILESIFLFVEFYQGKLRAPMRNLAIATMVSIGITYYVRQMVFGFYTGMQQQGVKDVKIPFFYSGGIVARGIDAAVCIILGLIGLGIIVVTRGRRNQLDTSS